MAIKQSIDLCPWADAVYGCDAAWWRYRRGLREFSGLKITWAGSELREYPDIRRIQIAKGGRRDIYSDDLQLEPHGMIGGGGNSGFQALNLVLQFGSRRIVLVGFDMSDHRGKHWYGRNDWPMSNNPSSGNFQRWMMAFQGVLPQLNRLGAKIVNASPESAMKVFPFLSLDKAISGF